MNCPKCFEGRSPSTSLPGLNHDCACAVLRPQIMAPEDDFVSVARITARDIARQVVAMAGQMEEEAWEAGGVQPPASLIDRGNNVLDSLANTTGVCRGIGKGGCQSHFCCCLFQISRPFQGRSTSAELRP